MKRHKLKTWSLVMAASMFLSLAPQSVVKAAETDKETVLFSNDFEGDTLPNEAGGLINLDDISIEDLGENSRALKFNAKFDGTDDWDNNKYEMAFVLDSNDTVTKGSRVEYDLIVPTEAKEFAGQIKTAGGFGTHNLSDDTWGWSSLNVGNISSSDFEDLGNGYSKVHVNTKIKEDVEGLYKLDIQIDAYNCDYAGDIYLDNIKLTKAGAQQAVETPSELKETELFTNDFENGILPNECGGQLTLDDISIAELGEKNKALKFNAKFDGTDDWDNNKYEMAFVLDSNDTITKGSRVEYDLIIPTEAKEFAGQIKTAGGFGTHNLSDDTWGWSSLNVGNISSSDFEDLGNGYSKVHVNTKIKEDVEGLYKLDIQIDAYNCDYAGDIYLDNIKLTKVEGGSNIAPSGEHKDLVWNFDDESKALDGWKYQGNWAYTGPHDVSYDKLATGSGSLKLDVDYSENAEASWSEVKIDNWINDGIQMRNYNQLKFNLYYNPDNMSKGSFKSKLWISDDINGDNDIDFSKARDAGNGLKKVPVTMNFDSDDVEVNGITLSIIGSNTDYKGSLYLDDITLTYKDTSAIYVDKTAVPREDATKIDLSSLDLDSSEKLVDADATDSAASLLAYLKAVGKKDYAIFGHQNDTYNKAGTIKNGTESDVKDLTGSIAGVCGIDGLSFTGDELSLPAGDTRDYVTAAADVSKNAAAQGAIVTLSCHMPNFAKVAAKGKKADGKYDYSGYSPNVTTGNVVERILPGGDLNEVFNGYLDMVADYGHQMEQAGVPVLFRPFHENDGSWFWWGKAYCDAQTYKALYAYTVEYLRDVKDVHNFLYVYSSTGNFGSKEGYLDRYPGDEFVDVMAFDQYHTNPIADGENDPWFKSFKENIEIVQDLAKEHGKLPTVGETGISITKSNDYEVSNCALPQYGNLNKKWFSQVSKIVADSDMPYYMVWANFNNKNNFYTPYLVNENKGHEMINDFIDYYNEDTSVFANGIGDYNDIKVDKESPYDYGYIQSPVSGSRILEPGTIKAKIKANSDDVKFVIKEKDGTVIDTLDAVLNDESGLYEADLNEELLEKVGEKVAKIQITIDGEDKAYGEYVFNIPEPVEINNVVDNFEVYGDEDALLQKTWNATNGEGCSVVPALDKDENGNHSMKFTYNISTSKTAEGYAGIVKSKEADWTSYDALQLKIKPDSYHQKLVIQITCNGEDFEYYPQFTSTDWQTLTIPFSELKGKNGGKFDAAHIEKFGLWCNTVVPEGHVGAFDVNSVLEFDNIKAVKASEVKAVEEAEEAVRLAETSLNIDDVESAKELVEALSDGDDKEALENRLNEVKEKIKSKLTNKKKNEILNKVQDLINKAGQDKDIDEYKKALDILDYLPDSCTEKDALVGRIKDRVKELNAQKKQEELRKLVDAAAEAIQKAANTLDEEDIAKAQEAVDSLEDGNEKDALQNRLNTVKSRL